MKKVAPLLVLSPHHGSVRYLWEKRGVTRWELVYTPSDTFCMLKVVAYINVQWKDKSSLK